MSERRGDVCWCPVLAAAAEMDQLAHLAGILRYGGSTLPLLTGILRDKYGCPGTQGSLCYWAVHAGKLHADHLEYDAKAGTPEVRPRPGDLPGEYL